MNRMTGLPPQFATVRLGTDMHLHVASTETFKRTTVAAFCRQPLAEETVAAVGLLPRVLRRGNSQWPTAMDLERELDGLYGTHLGTGVQKIGDTHLSWFVLNLPGDRYLDQPVFAKGIRILLQTMFSPVIEGEGLKKDYVEQEKQLQVGRIRSLINNKSSWAVFRCLQHMYQDDPFRHYELGTVEGVKALSAADLLRQHRRQTATAPIDFYVVGDVSLSEAQQALQEYTHIAGKAQEPVRTQVTSGTGESRTVVEEEVMGQGWIVLGFRTDVRYSAPERHAMSFLNGVLGGFVHSKLFLNVREKAGLAYQANSGYNANKGYLLAIAGIDPAKYQQALDIMLKQVDDLRRGNITAMEMDATRSRLLSRMRLTQDDAISRMMYHLTGNIEGSRATVQETLERIAAVSKEDVIAAAQRLRLDTIYFLKGVN
ncbi:MAG TPA: insulinase family protein [Firmicutes bacterium]|nr:insulinase family protein [Bacillota bacterium]